MRCISIHHSPIILPRLPEPTPFRFPNNAGPTALFHRRNTNTSSYSTPAAAATPFLAAAVPPSTSGDYTVMLQTGGLLFFLYLITNFLVPAMLFKGLKDDGSDKDKEA